MSKTLSQKKEMCAKIQDILNNNNCCLFVEHATITGDEFAEFRKLMHQHESQIFGIKKSLLEKTLPEKFQDLKNNPGSILIISSNDALKTLSAMKKAIKIYQGLQLHTSIVEDNLTNTEILNELSKYKNKDGLNSNLLGYLQLPISLMVDVVDQSAKE